MCILQSCVTIWSDGFSFHRDSNRELKQFPHSKGVKIGNNVQIFAQCAVARGILSDTLIGDGTKIDTFVHVAHNVIIGKNCEIVAGTILGGSFSIGDKCFLGMKSRIKNNIKIGNNVIVAAGAVVIKDVPNDDIVAGTPTKSIKDKVKLSSKELFLMTGQTKKELMNEWIVKLVD